MIRKDFAYCTTCKKYTTQSFIHEGELVIKSGDSITQRFCCDVCKTNNERTLQKCWRCDKHTSQELIEETPSENMEEISQMYKCKICDEINKTYRRSDSYIHRFINAKDEEGGIYCEFCMCYKKQILISKKHSKLSDNYDLTTYRCKTCNNENFGTQDRLDIR